MEPALKPCPFCQGTHVTDRYVRDGRQMFCQSCGASVAPTYRGPNNDTMERAIAAWNTRPQGQGDAVKPLEWTEPSQATNGCWTAKSALGTYSVVNEGGWYASRDDTPRDFYFEWTGQDMSRDTLDTAKAAAQTDYEQRIRSAIAATPSAPAQEIEGLVERLSRSAAVALSQRTPAMGERKIEPLIPALPALIARLEAATRADRTLDTDIAFTLLGWKRVEHKAYTNWHSAYSEIVDETGVPVRNLPTFTASIDATVALIERVLPGAEFSLSNLYGIALAELPLNFTHTPWEVGRRTDGNLAIALLIALLRAKEAINPPPAQSSDPSPHQRRA